MTYSIKAKLMIAVTSAAVLGMSAFMEPAEARGTGNGYSLPDGNEEFVDAQFDLVSTKKEGQPIFDAQGNVVGRRFLGAIENYTEGKGLLCNVDNVKNIVNDLDAICKNNSYLGSEYNMYYYLDKKSGFPIFKEPFDADENTRFNGDLVAEFLNSGQEEPIFKDEFFEKHKDNENPFSELFKNNPGQNAIVYSIVEPGETEKAVFSFLLKQEDIPNNDRCQNVNDKCGSLNDLEFILKNNLLGKAVPLRAVNNPTFGGNKTRLLIHNKFGEEVPVATVPEPSITLGALAAVGAGSLLKRKTKQS